MGKSISSKMFGKKSDDTSTYLSMNEEFNVVNPEIISTKTNVHQKMPVVDKYNNDSVDINSKSSPAVETYNNDFFGRLLRSLKNSKDKEQEAKVDRRKQLLKSFSMSFIGSSIFLPE